MQRSRSKITRDVRLVFDLFVDKATGATPGQSYIVQYERGERERGQSEPAKADAKGEVKFSFHTAFVSTLQRKNAMQYSTKNFRIFVTEHPGSLVVADTTYNLASSVDNEMFPSKTFLIRSKEKALKLTFTLSGMSEEDVRKVNNRRSLEGSNGPSSPSVTRPADTTTTTMHPAEDHSDEEEEASPSIRRQEGAGQPSDAHKVESDDDLFAMVDSAVAEKSARSETKSPANAATPNSSRLNRSVPPEPQPKATEQARRVVTDKPVAAAAPAVAVSASTHRSPSPPPPSQAAVAPPPPPPTTSTTVATSAPRQTPSEEATATIESIALSIKREASVEAATTSRLEDQLAQRRDEAEVRRVLSEVLASIVQVSKHVVPAVTTGGDQAAKTLKIPSPAMLIIHCLRTWNGPKRTLFLHDLICVLYCEAATHSRYTAEWVSTILHVLYDTLVMEEGRLDDSTGLSQSAVAALTSDLVDCMEHAARSNFGSANTFAIRGSRSDSLSRIFPVEVSSPKQKPMSRTEVVLLCAALDDSLRKLLTRLHSNVLSIIDRYCHAPVQTVTRLTVNGYKFTGEAELGGERHAVEDPALSIVLHTITDLYNKLYNSDVASPLVQLVSGELFRTIMSNINTAFLNHMVDRSNPEKPTLRVNSPKRGIQFKLCLSMLESWLQQRRMFNISRHELLPCRQYCDLILLPKVALRNIELREQTTSRLPPALVLFTLRNMQPSSSNKWALTEEDVVPAEVMELFAKLTKEQRRQHVHQSVDAATRYFAKESSADDPPIAPYRTFAGSSIVPFLIELVPKTTNRSTSSLHHLAVANEALAPASHGSSSQGSALDKRSTAAVMDWEYSAVELKAITQSELSPGDKRVAEAIFEASFARDAQIKEALVEYSL